MTKEDTRISEHYLGERGEKYLKNFNDLTFGRLYQTRYFRPYCSDNLVLLDLGCADGLFLRNLPAQKRIGVEANPAARERCSELCEKQFCSIELHSKLETVESETVDIAISNHCLEHVLNPFREVKHIKRILKAGGIFLLVAPFDDWRKKRHQIWVPGDIDNHLFTWSPMNLGNLLTEAGLQVEFANIYTRAWHPKFFWIYHSLGKNFFDFVCYFFGRLKNRREVFSKAIKSLQQSKPQGNMYG